MPTLKHETSAITSNIPITADIVAIHKISDSRCLYAYHVVGNDFCINTWDWETDTHGVEISVTLPFVPTGIGLLSANSFVACSASGAFIQADFALSNIQSTTINSFCVLDGHVAFVDTLNDVYLDWVYIKPAYNSAETVVPWCGEVIELFDDILLHGGKTIKTPAMGTSFCVSGGSLLISAGVSQISGDYMVLFVYDPIIKEIVCTSDYGLYGIVHAPACGKNCIALYCKDSRLCAGTPTKAYGELSEEVTDITPTGTQIIRYGIKKMHVRYNPPSLTLYSNTTCNHVGSSVNCYFGSFKSASFVVAGTSNYSILDAVDTCDGDYFDFSGDLRCGYAAQKKDGTLVGIVDGTLPLGTVAAIQVSGNITLDGGIYTTMTVNAANSTVMNATITDLIIGRAYNITFIGCNITAYVDLGVNNTFRFIGCTIAGIPHNSAAAITYSGADSQLLSMNVQNALDTLSVSAGRYAANAIFTAIGPVFDDKTIITTLYTLGESVITLTVDVAASIINPGGGEHAHRQIVSTIYKNPAEAITELAQEETIFFESAFFTSARVDPGAFLAPSALDYVELNGLTVTVRAINTTVDSTIRYSVTYKINEVLY